ncbi:MAG: signal recognition particle protein [Candidatus Dormibacteraceae bacterium]
MFENLSERLGKVLKQLGNRGVLRSEEVEASLREVRMALLEADVNYRVVKEFTQQLRERLIGREVESHLTAPQQVVQAVQEELTRLLGSNQRGIVYSSTPPTVLILVGLQGAGKTTACIKLAHLAVVEGHRPLVVGLDLRRPAAIEQLRQLAEREKVKFFSGSGEVESIAQAGLAEASALNCDVVILDTAGRMAVDGELMAELGRLREAVPEGECLLVIDAMTGQEAVSVGQAFQQAIGVEGVVLTKLDGDARGGAALSLKVAAGQTVRFAGLGERPADLEVFHADRMASRILGMGDMLSLIEKAERNLTQSESQAAEQSLLKGQLTFEDLLLQLGQLRQLGSFESVIGMLPGGNQLTGQISGDPEREMGRMEAIILSMTIQERRQPEVLDGRRRRRIAAGSGTKVSDVNKLIKLRRGMNQMMKQMGGKGLARLGGKNASLGGLGKLFGR